MVSLSAAVPSSHFIVRSPRHIDWCGLVTACRHFLNDVTYFHNCDPLIEADVDDVRWRHMQSKRHGQTPVAA